jgi:hypothetical protein
VLKTKEQVTEELVATGREIAPDNPAQRTANRRVSSINGVHVYFSAEEETARDAEEKAVADERADYEANHKYKDDRKSSYPTIGDQLDMLWHAIDSGDWTAAKVKTTDFYTKLKTVKDDNPKPEE